MHGTVRFERDSEGTDSNLAMPAKRAKHKH